MINSVTQSTSAIKRRLSERSPKKEPTSPRKRGGDGSRKTQASAAPTTASMRTIITDTFFFRSIAEVVSELGSMASRVLRRGANAKGENVNRLSLDEVDKLMYLWLTTTKDGKPIKSDGSNLKDRYIEVFARGYRATGTPNNKGYVQYTIPTGSGTEIDGKKVLVHQVAHVFQTRKPLATGLDTHISHLEQAGAVLNTVEESQKLNEYRKMHHERHSWMTLCCDCEPACLGPGWEDMIRKMVDELKELRRGGHDLNDAEFLKTKATVNKWLMPIRYAFSSGVDYSGYWDKDLVWSKEQGVVTLLDPPANPFVSKVCRK